MTTTREQAVQLQLDALRRGIEISSHDALTLTRAARTLDRWSALECGDGNDYASWAIERDPDTDIPYMCTYPHTGNSRRARIADRETAALKRVQNVCKSLGLTFYHQSDPRGWPLYFAKPEDNMTDCNYSSVGFGVRM